MDPRQEPLPIRWFKADENFDELGEWLRQAAPTVDQTISCLDVFGASKRVADTWQDAGFKASSYDIKLSHEDDICSERGCKKLLHMGLQPLVCNFCMVPDLQGNAISYWGIDGICFLPHY